MNKASEGTGTPSAANVQGALHVGSYLGGKKRKLRKDALRTLYINRPVLNGEDIIAWAKSVGFPTTVPADQMHVTIAHSKTPVDWNEIDADDVEALPIDVDNRAIIRFGSADPRSEDQKAATVLGIESRELGERWKAICDAGASWDFPEYKPHITVSWDAPKEAVLWQPYKGPIILGPEEFDEVRDGWKDDLIEKIFKKEFVMQKLGARNSKSDLQKIQAMHDHSTDLGAHCRCPRCGEGMEKIEKTEAEIDKFRIAKVDDELGLVFGYAIICKANGSDYYDLNIDHDSGQRVPEHIPEATMLKAAADFMQNSRAGNEMHSGPDKGTYVFAFPLTSDIAKALGIETNVTGLIVGFKPSTDMLAKFKDGTYKGFSIEGKRLHVEDLES